MPVITQSRIDPMKTALIGYGKMGREIASVLRQRGHEVGLIVDAANTADLNEANMDGIDVAIEFTGPEGAFSTVMECLRLGVPVVSGSTGWNDGLPEAKQFCIERGGTLFHSPNFSIGVNIFFRLNEILARMMNDFPDYNVSITEVHHIHKKDSPSGTAVSLAEGILANLERKSSWVNHQTLEESSLGIASIREGEVPGIHEVAYESEADVLTIRHESKSRAGLALGAVLAAEFAARNPGVLSMGDLLGF